VHPKIPIDTFVGRAWIGVTPFLVTGFHIRLTPPLPVVSRFQELNVRTYATIDGKPGIYFFSLDARSRLAVEGARRLYRVPYFRADMRATLAGEPVEFQSQRIHRGAPPAAFKATYGPTGPPANARPGSFEHWCTERYCLYTLDARQRVLRGDIHHPPWPLQPAAATITENTMGEQVGVDLEGDPLLHYAERQDVTFWPLAHG
jgi:uncharacterized protein YqjF (DUF2071 family)